MLGVDRLDMIKGIPQKILAFEKFLEENPYWHDKVVLLQIAVPTRTDVPECMVYGSSIIFDIIFSVFSKTDISSYFSLWCLQIKNLQAKSTK